MNEARRAAVDVLLRLERGRTTLAAELERARAGLTDRRDRGLLGELVTGTLRWRNELDALIGAASRRRTADLDTQALSTLRLGVYQLRHLDRIPAHAVVDESVDVVRAIGAARAAGFVNAVLRTVIRLGPRLKLPARPDPRKPAEAQIPYLSVTLSHPDWLVARWLGRYGFEATERWCLFNNTSPDLTLRPLGTQSAASLVERLREHGLAGARAPYVHDAVRLAPGVLGRLPPELAETVLVQDEGSQLVARFAAAVPGERVLDVCAAPGGKTVVLATDLASGSGRPASRSRLVAADRRFPRVRALAATLGRAGLSVPIVMLDAQHPLPFGPTFDCVLVDAPCSGLGTLRRDPDLKWHRREADLDRLAADQLRMLRSAADAVRPGGRLVYATCSTEPEENTGVVDEFLREDGRFALAPARASDGLPGAVLDAHGRLATDPVHHGLDGYFAARLVRHERA